MSFADSIIAELDSVLEESISSVTERERNEFDRLVEPFGQSIVLFGAGNLGRRVLARLRMEGIEPMAFSDNNPSIHGKTIDGLQVLSPRNAADRFGSKAAFVVTIWNTDHSFVQTRKQLSSLGCTKVVSVVPLRWKYAETFLPFLWSDLPSKVIQDANTVRSVYSVWNDEFSRREYVAQIKFRLLGDFVSLSPPVLEKSYFPDDLFRSIQDENFVDCGAYDGVTIKHFLRHVSDFTGRILAYEPDPISYRKLREYLSSLNPILKGKIAALPYAVGARREKVNFNATGLMDSAINSNGSVEIDCVTLDASLRENEFIPTYIKMDIEGTEFDALTGAQDAIRRYSPLLAVCLYHRIDDLWRIPELINSLSDRYHLFLRPCELEGWQLVCYAVPEARLLKRAQE